MYVIKFDKKNNFKDFIEFPKFILLNRGIHYTT